MRTRILQSSLFVGAVAALALPLLHAQITEYQEHQWLNTPAATSHINGVTGDARNAAYDYRRYCVGCHGELGDGNGENAI